ncbi:alpha-(1,3)-fucosyltransferase C [Eurytemora carolleeae]|uniref:alpha-(1,3)-fucosyltransferase C n=1 Tax=Eurytemora carolleeae TaxID=1294199 RepID=UPI000C776A69|nr:alpha-(1,3)-fucosyltransferase C [Eurytemora carolleeae]|eukprot:XP_023343120.1 alpha-(1,3)-fucosyltransferase C-like [Eurytemora affinis]
MSTPFQLLRINGGQDRPTIKYILYYTKFWSTDNFGYGFGQQSFIVNNCSVNNCFITNNRSLLSDIKDFDMLIFHSQNIKDHQIPVARSPKQLYVFFSLESPINDNIDGFSEEFQSFFNLTMTYRRDSDIFSPYGEMTSIRTDSRDNISGGKMDKKELNFKTIDDRKLVAWVVSHCQTDSQREEYVKELKKWIPIDQFGKCSKNKNECDDSCYGNLGTRYKFYLSFENSLCEDYITEKFWNTLEQSMVPIVLGSGNYKDVAPPHSYINVQDFKSPKELAEYLLKLDKNSKDYNRFLDWKTSHRIQSSRQYFKGQMLCDLCEKVHNTEKKVYSSFGDWWEKDKCSRLVEN